MTGIDRISAAPSPLGVSAAPNAGAREAAAGAIGTVGDRVLAWVDASARTDGAGRQAWAAATGGDAAFRPDARELARGGDVYGLGDLAAGIARDLGGTPAQEGALRRSLEDFTREAVVQLAGLAGAPGDRQVAGVRDALEAAGNADAPDGVDGVIARLDAAAAMLARQNHS
ncbi:hypothetical protein [Sphingomonas lenta]|uniref:Uncharacterized protein n=1 Tax=Sphingomonas lenta TaxID=1141887 RepID=A0A2A2SCQ2_9SPHN|nr:hypothetical protein [Sphingomonas lenta]PAX06970.1 hypothetical protein CKY28_12950 [Sphingomonas lenta]